MYKVSRFQVAEKISKTDGRERGEVASVRFVIPFFVIGQFNWYYYLFLSLVIATLDRFR